MLIKGGRVIDPASGTDKRMDIRIADGKIIEMGRDLEAADLDSSEEIIDANGKIVAPGLVDVHVHFRDPGFTYKEDIFSGASSAARGGFTTVICMANTNPAVDNVETLRYVLEKGKETDIHVMSCTTLTKNMAGEELTDLEELAAAGAAGFTDDGIPVVNEALLREAMERAVKLDLPISLHEELPAFVRTAGIHAGKVAEEVGLEGAEALAEDIMVARDCMLALHTGVKLNIQHISSKNSVELVRNAKKMGARVYAEATPHHFSLTEEDVLKHGTYAKMNPPLRTAEDREAIIQGLCDGTIDMIATDHAPHSKEEKERPFMQAPSGIIGLETSLALGITNLVKKGYLTISQLIEKMSLNPAMLYKLDAGRIREGGLADLVIFDDTKMVTMGNYASKAENTPFTGEKLFGKIYMTICGGRVVSSSPNQ